MAKVWPLLDYRYDYTNKENCSNEKYSILIPKKQVWMKEEYLIEKGSDAIDGIA